MHDGSITFSTVLDNAQLEKDLAGLTKKIEKKERDIAEITSKRDQAQGILDSSELEAEGKKLEEMRTALEKNSELTKRIVSLDEKEKSLTVDIAQKEKDRADAVRQRSEILDRLSVAEERLGTLENAPIKDRGKIKEQKEEVRILAREMSKLDGAVQKYDAEIKKSTDSLEEQKSRFAQLVQQLDPISAPTKEEVDAQSEKVKKLSAEWKAAEKDVKRYNTQLSVSEKELNHQKEEAGELTRRIEEANSTTGKMAGAVDQAGVHMAKFTDRVKKLASRVFVFTLITTALRSMRTWMGKVIKTNGEARQSTAQLKAALLTLAQPLVEVIIPAFITVVNVLTRIITAVAQLVSMLFGKTLKQSKDGAKALYKEASGIKAVGDAADEAAGSLAGFDEINTINTENASGADGGAASDTIEPDFSWADDMGGMLDRLKEIADLVGLIAAGLALWKLSSILPGVLGTIAEKLAGILLTVGGLLLYWHGLTDAWESGVDWLNLIEMIGGLAAAALGLYLLLGPIAAGIALIVGGLGMLVTVFHDAMENGWNLQNTLLSIAGIMAAGLGIALITGSWIPLLIAGIASVLLALTVFTGHGEELIEGIRTVLEGFADFFTGIFTGDMEKAIGGISKIFDGLKTSVFAVIDGIKDAFLGFLNWLDEKTGGRFHGIIETAKKFIAGFFESVKTTLGDVLDSVKRIFTGITQFMSGMFTNNWDMAWEGVKNIFKGAWNGIVSLLEGAVNLIIRGLNWLISKMNKIKFDVPSWVPGVGGKSLGVNIPPIPEAKIPRLAQGAVIPPNREFMAVLGDQSHGNNLEAPEDLIRKIVREESGGSDELVQLLQSILAAVKSGHVIMVDGTTFGRTAIRTINAVTTSAGKPLLLI